MHGQPREQGHHPSGSRTLAGAICRRPIARFRSTAPIRRACTARAHRSTLSLLVMQCCRPPARRDGIADRQSAAGRQQRSRLASGVRERARATGKAVSATGSAAGTRSAPRTAWIVSKLLNSVAARTQSKSRGPGSLDHAWHPP